MTKVSSNPWQTSQLTSELSSTDVHHIQPVQLLSASSV